MRGLDGRLVATAALALVLGACGDKADRQAASGGDSPTAEQMADTMQASFKPGTWKVNVEIEDVEMTGMPAGAPVEAMKDAMKKSMAATEVMHCITPEQAAKPDAEMLAARRQANCTYSNTSFSAGKVHSEMVCTPQGAEGGGMGTMTAVMDGSYGPESYAMTMNLAMKGGAEGMGMTMKSRTTGQWMGPDCRQGG